MYQDLWEEFPEIERHRSALQRMGMTDTEIQKQVQDMKARQSETAGVSPRYLLSDSFASLASQRSGKADPDFNDMKDAFWLCDDPLGQDVNCPRDGRPGCALVDWMPRLERGQQTHFISWTWRYKLSQIHSAVAVFQSESTSDAFFYMCFFVNNQHRILLEASGVGSEELENIFESNLTRVGQMVAILDTWDQPTYLTRQLGPQKPSLFKSVLLSRVLQFHRFYQ